MPDLVEWLETAISEREQAAREAYGFDGQWTASGSWTSVRDGDGDLTEMAFLGDASEHVALHDPDAVLRRCAADRKILADWLERSANPFEGMTDDELHDRRMHPAYEYATTEGQRKAWDYSDVPPGGDDWERNTTARFPEAWERFDYHEESYWRRLRPDGVREWQRPEPPLYIRLLAEGYGYQEAANHG